MKRMFKWGWLFLVVGVIFLAIGAFAHGAKDVVFNGWKPVVYSNKANYQHSYSTEAFKQVDVTVGNANVVIRRGDNYGVKYHGRKSARPRVKVLNGRLVVRQKGTNLVRKNFLGFHWSGDEYRVSNKLTVYIPDNVKLNRIRNLNNRGTTVIEGVSTGYLEAIGSLGLLNLRNVNVDNTNIEVRDDADIRLEDSTILGGLITGDNCDVVAQNGTLRGVELQQSDGDITMRNVSLDGGKANVTDGDVKITDSTVTNGYSLINNDGNNTLTNVKAGGYDLTANANSHNDLFGNHQKSGSLHSGTATNVLTIFNTDGDNTVR